MKHFFSKSYELSVFQSKQRKKYFILQFCTRHAKLSMTRANEALHFGKNSNPVKPFGLTKVYNPRRLGFPPQRFVQKTQNTIR